MASASDTFRSIEKIQALDIANLGYALEEKNSRVNEEATRLAREEEGNPFGRHRWVKLKDLQTKKLNGKFAEIINPSEGSGEEDRFGVRVLATKKIVGIKRMNLEAIPDAETIKCCRMNAAGEKGRGRGRPIDNVHWPRSVLESSYGTVCPISVRLGFPLRIARVLPRSKLTDRAHYDNQWVTWMMIDSNSGFAPPKWQSNIGSVVVWRQNGLPISADDMCLLNDFLSRLLDLYPELDGEVDPDRYITPSAWTHFKEGAESGYGDINI